LSLSAFFFSFVITIITIIIIIVVIVVVIVVVAVVVVAVVAFCCLSYPGKTLSPWLPLACARWNALI